MIYKLKTQYIRKLINNINQKQLQVSFNKIITKKNQKIMKNINKIN